MASINGITPGLVPIDTSVPKAIKPSKAMRKTRCVACSGIVPHKRGRALMTIDNLCLHCIKMFGGDTPFDFVDGATNAYPKEALNKIEKAIEYKFAMALISRSFYGADTGQSFTIERGDVFHVHKQNPIFLNEECSWERTKSMFTLTVNVGKNILTLYPHEFAPINFLTVMELRKMGELEEKFLENDDQHGYFAPSQEIRELINNSFGR